MADNEKPTEGNPPPKVDADKQAMLDRIAAMQSGMDEMSSRLAAAQGLIKAAEDKRLTESQSFKELADKRGTELADLRKSVDESDKLSKFLKELGQPLIHDDYIKFIDLEGLTPETMKHKAEEFKVNYPELLKAKQTTMPKGESATPPGSRSKEAPKKHLKDMTDREAHDAIAALFVR